MAGALAKQLPGVEERSTAWCAGPSRAPPTGGHAAPRALVYRLRREAGGIGCCTTIAAGPPSRAALPRAAGHRHALARHSSSVVGGEEQRDPRDILRRPQASKRVLHHHLRVACAADEPDPLEARRLLIASTACLVAA
jgi:hypothetical protein